MNYQCFQEVTFFSQCSLFAFWGLFVLLSKILAENLIEGKGQLGKRQWWLYFVMTKFRKEKHVDIKI